MQGDGVRQVERIKVQKWRNGKGNGNPVININRVAGQKNGGMIL